MKQPTNPPGLKRSQGQQSENSRSAFLPDTPLGPLLLTESAAGLARIKFCENIEPGFDNDLPDSPLLSLAMEQIRDYLDGRRQSFDLPIDWRQMPPFQARVLRGALQIPYGQTWTYGDLALDIGQPGASRAVGLALGKNPLPIVIPCHRVMGSQGKLQGYSAPDGLNKKIWLLKLEGVLLIG